MFKDVVRKEQEERNTQKGGKERSVSAGKVMGEKDKQREKIVADSELDETIPYIGEEADSDSGDIDITVETVGQEDRGSKHETEVNGNIGVMMDWDDDLYSDEMRPTKKRQRFSNAPAIQGEIMELYRKGGESIQPKSQSQQCRDQKCEEHVENEKDTKKVQTNSATDNIIDQIGEIRRSQRIRNKSKLNATSYKYSKNVSPSSALHSKLAKRPKDNNEKHHKKLTSVNNNKAPTKHPEEDSQLQE